jgi:secreted trypsin-like serine protease
MKRSFYFAAGGTEIGSSPNKICTAVFATMAAAGIWLTSARPAAGLDNPPFELTAGITRSLPASIAKQRLKQSSAAVEAGLIKVVGGKEAKKGQFKSQIAMILAVASQDDPFSGYFCGGTLIARRWVLTAAHCTYEDNPQGKSLPPIGIGREEINVYLGSNDFTGGQRITVKRIVRHESYDSSRQDNDLALLELETEPSAKSDVELSRLISPSNDAVLTFGRRATVVLRSPCVQR